MKVTFKSRYEEAHFEDLFSGTVFTTKDDPDHPCLKLEDEVETCQGYSRNAVSLLTGDLFDVDPDTPVYVPDAELILG